MDYNLPKVQAAEDAETDEDLVLLNGIEKDLDSEKSCCPDIKDKLANIINKRFSSVLQPEKKSRKNRRNMISPITVQNLLYLSAIR